MQEQDAHPQHRAAEQGRELQRRLLQAHLDLRGARERPVPVRGDDDVDRTYRRPSRRPLGTLLGPVLVSRLAYQAAEVDGRHPLDASLNLPNELYSHGVCRFVAEHAAMMPFDDVVHELQTSTGAEVGKRQAEEITMRAANDVEAFYAGRRAANEVLERTDDLPHPHIRWQGHRHGPGCPAPVDEEGCEQGSAQARHAPHRRREAQPQAHGRSSGKVPRFVRTPIDVLADLRRRPDDEARRDRHARRPKVRNKRVFASVELDPEVVIEEAFCEAEARDPEHRRPWVVLVDGNKDQLALAKAAAKKRDVEVTVIVDRMHVLEYLWRAAHAFCAAGSETAEGWVQQRLMWLLQGRPAGKIATAMRQAARAANLADTGLAAVHDTADYLQHYAPSMRYGNAIAEGSPSPPGSSRAHAAIS